MTIRIGQLTDIHVADFADLGPLDFVGKRATGWLNYTQKRADEYDRRVLDSAVARLVGTAPDLVVVSGDLSNLGLRSELRAALGVLEPLRQAGIRTVVIPGNHDAYVRSSARGQFEQVCAEWQQADARVEGHAYPFVVRCGPVAVVCFDSGIPTPPMLAYGRVDDAQLARAAKLIQAEKAAGRAIVFAVHHHATRAPHRRYEWPRGMHNVANFRRLAARADATLVMHGHNHYLHRRRMRGAESVCICGLSSSTTGRTEPPERVGQAGLYEVGASGLERAGVASWDGRRVLFGEWQWTRPDEIPVETGHEALDAG